MKKTNKKDDKKAEFNPNKDVKRRNRTTKKNKKNSSKRSYKSQDRKIVYFIILIFAAFVLGALGMSVIKFVKSQLNSEEYDFNGFHFYKTDLNIWRTNFKYNNQLYEVNFRYDPKSLLNLEVPDNVKLLGKLKELTLILEPDLESTYVIGAVEIAKIMSRVLKIQIYYGFTQNTSKNISVITCDKLKGIGIYFTKNNETNRVYWDKNCLVINTTDGWNAVKYSDLIVYKILGILN